MFSTSTTQERQRLAGRARDRLLQAASSGSSSRHSPPNGPRLGGDEFARRSRINNRWTRADCPAQLRVHSTALVLDGSDTTSRQHRNSISPAGRDTSNCCDAASRCTTRKRGKARSWSSSAHAGTARERLAQRHHLAIERKEFFVGTSPSSIAQTRAPRSRSAVRWNHTDRAWS